MSLVDFKDREGPHEATFEFWQKDLQKNESEM